MVKGEADFQIREVEDRQDKSLKGRRAEIPIAKYPSVTYAQAWRRGLHSAPYV